MIQNGFICHHSLEELVPVKILLDNLCQFEILTSGWQKATFLRATCRQTLSCGFPVTGRALAVGIGISSVPQPKAEFI